ncbi:MAG: Smr/MutS family protein [Burkholderiales bacterium]|nr:Smr/MutS family protein [Burkholderiales bacterium]
MRDALRAAAAAAAVAQARAALEAAQQERMRNQFAHAVGRVQPVKTVAKAHLPKPLPAPEPLQRMADEAAALKEALSDEVDLESLLLTDDGLSYRRPEVSLEVAKLRKGHWAIQHQIDLHGPRRDEAREALSGFIRLAHQNGQRCLRVVHGKGHGSPGKQPVLKAKVQRWLAQRQEVIAFAQASGPQGGAGALIVLLAGRVR